MNSEQFRMSRQALSMTQRQLAAELGVSLVSVRRWEYGWWPVPKSSALAMRYLVMMASERPLEVRRTRIDGQGRVWPAKGRESTSGGRERSERHLGD